MKKSNKIKYGFNEKAINKLLVDKFSGTLESQAQDVAERVRQKVPEDIEVAVNSGIGSNGRPYGIVTIKHASGLGRQAKHGVLTKSAAEEGLDTKRYNRKGML